MRWRNRHLLKETSGLKIFEDGKTFLKVKVIVDAVRSSVLGYPVILHARRWDKTLCEVQILTRIFY